MLALSTGSKRTGSKRTGNIATGNEVPFKCVATLPLLRSVTEGRSSKITQLLRICYKIIR